MYFPKGLIFCLVYCIKLYSIVNNWLETQTNFFFFCLCGRDRLNGGADAGEVGGNKAEIFLYSPLKIVFFVALMCGMLVLMYFFYNVLGEWGKKQSSTMKKS